jgi:hypothetical protein
MGGRHHAPATLPPVKTHYPWYRRLGGMGVGLEELSQSTIFFQKMQWM